jgi:hypothetical protein
MLERIYGRAQRPSPTNLLVLFEVIIESCDDHSLRVGAPPRLPIHRMGNRLREAFIFVRQEGRETGSFLFAYLGPKAFYLRRRWCAAPDEVESRKRSF